MSAVCAACEWPIEEPLLAAGDLHVDCAIDRVAQDAVVALAGAIVLVLAPLVIVWAG